MRNRKILKAATTALEIFVAFMPFHVLTYSLPSSISGCVQEISSEGLDVCMPHSIAPNYHALDGVPNLSMVLPFGPKIQEWVLDT